MKLGGKFVTEFFLSVEYTLQLFSPEEKIYELKDLFVMSTNGPISSSSFTVSSLDYISSYCAEDLGCSDLIILETAYRLMLILHLEGL